MSHRSLSSFNMTVNALQDDRNEIHYQNEKLHGVKCVYEIYHHIALLMLYTVTIMSYYHSAKHGQARDGRSYHYHSITCMDEPPLRAKSMVSDTRHPR